MTTITDGEKPRLTLVHNEPDDYPAHMQAVLQALKDARANGDEINPNDYLSKLDPKRDNSTFADYAIANGLMTRAKFDAAMARYKRRERVQGDLGFVPEDAQDLVNQYTKLQNITLTPKGILKRKRVLNIGGELVDEVRAEESEVAKYLYQVATAQSETLEDLRRELRLLVSKHGLQFSDNNIRDAVEQWRVDARKEAHTAMMMDVQYAPKTDATGAVGQQMWRDMERACFDVSETAEGFAIAVVQKFIWSVKRKARGLPITNHLMPVLTGAQGKGKSTFVAQLCRPLEDSMRAVDFHMLTDSKTADVWGSYILFLDEMGFFTKANVEVVKGRITSEHVPIRSMGTNYSENVQNMATLIGCTNKSLEQLIRDDTGVRRFAELQWRFDADWAVMNSLDWQLLWQSVDESAEDPIKQMGMTAHLSQQQASNRAMSAVETWARENAHMYTNWKGAKDLYAVYHDWEKEAYPRWPTDISQWGKDMRSLIKNMPDFPWEVKRARDSVKYRGTATNTLMNISRND